MESSFATDFRALLTKHGIKHPRFAYGADTFDPAKPKVLYSGPMYDENELVAATVALVEGKWSVAGEYVHRFEQAFSRHIGQKESVMLNSGSSADLLMAAAAKKRFGWKDGDGILVSPCGFPTTISAITLNGLRPVFVDIEWETLNADSDIIEQILENALPNDIRAIFVSPVLGHPPDMDRLTDMADKHGVKILLDGCDSLGSKWRGRPLSDFVTATTCSFFPSHHISTLQGGMISSNDEGLIESARQMATWGRGCHCVGAANLLPNGSCGKRFGPWLESCPDTIVDHRYTYGTDRAYNLTPLDMQGALGMAQMAKLPGIEAARRVNWTRLLGLFDHHLPECHTVIPVTNADPCWFGFPVICRDYGYKTRLVDHLEKNGVQTRNYFAGNILLHSGYAHLGKASDFPNSNEVLRRVFFIGCAPFYTEEHFGHIERVLVGFEEL